MWDTCLVQGIQYEELLCGSQGKESACSVGDLDLIPGLGRSPGGGHGSPPQILAWRIPMDRGAWWATVHGIAELDMTEQLSTNTQAEAHSNGLRWKCYAQVAKSPNDHQGANIRCKSKRVFITKIEIGLPPLSKQRLRRGAPSFGLRCLYREYSGERVTNGVFRLKDYWLVTLFYRVVCGFLIGFFTSMVNHYFQGKSQR